MKLKSALLGAAAAFAFAPAAMAERGADGHVNVIYWQAPSILNPFLSGGTKDVESSSLILEPLARYDQTGTLVPYLAEDIPTLENGGVSEDLTSITWKLKPGLLWSDGTPVTSADDGLHLVLLHPSRRRLRAAAKFEGVERRGDRRPDRSRSPFGPQAQPLWPLHGRRQSPILQAAQFADCLGTKAQECTEAELQPDRHRPVPVTEFRPMT
jgi:peptide/nickel transport system substrate-binding protein